LLTAAGWLTAADAAVDLKLSPRVVRRKFKGGSFRSAGKLRRIKRTGAIISSRATAIGAG